nr:hypothetical protein BaRGS_028175 [Batillaria attramentaria]
MATEVDLVNRDPNGINSHIQVNFEDTIAEPEGAHSIDCVWRASYSCFNCWKNFYYKLCTLLCGIPMAMCWGCEFAAIALQHVWCLTPCMRSWVVNIGICQKFYGSLVQCCIGPCCETCGLFFSNIVVKNTS